MTVFFVCILFTGMAFGDTINVPTDYPTIQDGIDAAGDGDLVLVAPGTYFENIDFSGKGITVRSEHGDDVTVIDGGYLGSVATFVTGETEDAVLSGFKISNGNGSYLAEEEDYFGGGIYCHGASPTIENCTVSDNFAYGGGAGVCLWASSSTITNSVIQRIWP